jgi:hypothetical protein
MADSNQTAVQFLEELRREREELTTLIHALEKRLGISTQSQRSEDDSQPAVSRAGLSIENIPVGFFHNLSQAAATEKLLRLNPGVALSNTEILDAFRRSGMKVNAKNAFTILYTALRRSPKFERVGRKAWGLAEWYPQTRKKKEQASEEEASSSSEDES